jgi:hypothetical protein
MSRCKYKLTDSTIVRARELVAEVGTDAAAAKIGVSASTLGRALGGLSVLASTAKAIALYFDYERVEGQVVGRIILDGSRVAIVAGHVGPVLSVSLAEGEAAELRELAAAKFRVVVEVLP